MTHRRSFTRWLIFLFALHGIVACAGFFAPYDPIEQDRKNPYVPPMRPHLVDAQGHFHFRPLVYSLKLQESAFDQYEEDTAHPNPLKFFVTGARYRLLGFLPFRVHLFGAETTRIYLLGSDAFGRDQFSNRFRPG